MSREQKTSMEIADDLVDRWANHEMGPLDIPKGRLWMLKQEIAEIIRRERNALRRIRDRYEREDTGEGFPTRGGPMAWAMHDDALQVVGATPLESENEDHNAQAQRGRERVLGKIPG